MVCDPLLVAVPIASAPVALAVKVPLAPGAVPASTLSSCRPASPSTSILPVTADNSVACRPVAPRMAILPLLAVAANDVASNETRCVREPMPLAASSDTRLWALLATILVWALSPLRIAPPAVTSITTVGDDGS